MMKNGQAYFKNLGMFTQIAYFLRVFQPPLFLRHPPFDPACSTPFQGILDSLPHPHATPSCPNPTNQPS